MLKRTVLLFLFVALTINASAAEIKAFRLYEGDVKPLAETAVVTTKLSVLSIDGEPPWYGSLVGNNYMGTVVTAETCYMVLLPGRHEFTVTHPFHGNFEDITINAEPGVRYALYAKVRGMQPGTSLVDTTTGRHYSAVIWFLSEERPLRSKKLQAISRAKWFKNIPSKKYRSMAGSAGERKAETFREFFKAHPFTYDKHPIIYPEDDVNCHSMLLGSPHWRELSRAWSKSVYSFADNGEFKRVDESAAEAGGYKRCPDCQGFKKMEKRRLKKERKKK